MTTKELENYEPKGELTGFPKEVIARMLDCQEEQGNKIDISVFEENKFSAKAVDGFDWDKTKEGYWFWEEIIRKRNFNPFFKQFLEEVIREKNFNLFFEKYPKQDNQDNSQEFNLENYVPKGELEGFPKEIIAKMLDCQEEQGTKRDVTVFEKHNAYSLGAGGFDWNKTKEKDDFWYEVISYKNFNVFFEKYPKQDNQDNNSQEFKVGDEVVDIISGVRGKITCIDTLNNDSYPIFVEFNDNEEASFTLDGRYYGIDKYPSLLHYRDDYNYDIIDFNNLPKKQEHQRWRAEEGGCYHFVSFDKRCWFYSNRAKDDYASFDNNNYNSGNYFRTEVEAEIIAQELNSYFKQLIKEEHDTHRN